MNIASKVGSAISAAKAGWSIAAGGGRPVVLAESSVIELENETVGMRLIGGSKRDLGAWDQVKMQKLALHLSRHNHMAKRMLDIIVDFIVGDGIKTTAKHEDEERRKLIQSVLDRLWQDPINDMQRQNPQRVFELFLWGEVLMPAKVNELTGDVRLGWIDPSQIDKIEPDKMTKRPAYVKLMQEAGVEAEVEGGILEVVRFSFAEGRLVGNAFYHQINCVMTGRRGISEYFTALDWFDVLDEFMKIANDRAKALMDYIWDVTLEGADDTDIKKFKRSQEAPRPASLRVHNEKVKWDAKAPPLVAYEASRHVKDLKTYIMGGYGYPNHWFGSGDDANLATAEQMSEPTRKALRRKTQQVVYLLTDICRFALYQAQVAPQGILNGVDVDVMSDCFEVVVPDIGGSDVAKIGSALQTVTASVSQAQSDELCSKDTGRKLFAVAASMIGVQIDPAQEKLKIDEERKDREKVEADENRKVSDLVAAGMRDLDRRAVPPAAGADGEDLPAEQ